MKSTGKRRLQHIFFCTLIVHSLACHREKDPNAGNKDVADAPLFTLLPPEQTHIDFRNELTEGLNTNVLMYEYLYNGGGVATVDLNGDGLIDVYFSSNMGENKCYLNKGAFSFQDVTTISKVSGRPGPWKTGISAVDINGDSRMDLYLSYSGSLPESKRRNELFINMGNNENNIPIFEEQAARYGLDSPAFSNQAYFFDYDHDGDLDALLLNHNPRSLPVLNEVSTASLLKQDDPLQGVRLLKQQDGKFTDVTLASGISGSPLTYGLGIAISDLNNDGWSDFYISNDYTVPDYLYMNNQDGTFTDKLKSSLGHTSQFSMGNNIADINNDGLQDIYTLDMLPEDNKRQKLLLAPDNYAKFELNLRSGFHYQYMRNMLQMNNGNGTFSEVGQLAGVSNTDWSWAALLSDFDNDGWKDLFVTNGYFRDYTNLDFINYMENYVASKGRLKREDVLQIINKMPASDLTNYLFINQGGTSFRNLTREHGLEQEANSNGAAYADLDNDGDLDLVVNNINQPAFIYRNEARQQGGESLQVTLKGDGLNSQGIGARVTLYANGSLQVLEQSPIRGYLSTVSPVLHFGLGKGTLIDSLEVCWNSGNKQILFEVESGAHLILKESDASVERIPPPPTTPLLQGIPSPVDFQGTKYPDNDFKRQSLLLSQFSHTGPSMAKGDVNNDGLEDIFIGGGREQSAALFLQQENGNFTKKRVTSFETDKARTDVDAAFLDANLDGQLDLYVASGGYFNYDEKEGLLEDRLYLGDGRGNFTINRTSLPPMSISNGTISVADINGDGYPDIFAGGRVVPGRYPEAPDSCILINDGKGNFTDQTDEVAPELRSPGMVTDALWIDINGDQTMDLVIVGEWMPVRIFINHEGKLKEETKTYIRDPASGWWNTIETGDFNQDGKPDLIAGNMGINTQFRVSEKEPAEMYYADFDHNGSIDPIFCFYIQGKSYPYLTRDELLGQLSMFRSRFNSYESYATATLEDIFTEEQLKMSGKLSADHMETTLFLSTPETSYEMSQLPVQAQYAPVYNIVPTDVNSDGNIDLILFGNNHRFKLRLGKFDANYGILLLGDGEGDFEYADQITSGLAVKGEVSSCLQIGDLLLIGIREKEVASYKIKR